MNVEKCEKSERAEKGTKIKDVGKNRIDRFQQQLPRLKRRNRYKVADVTSLQVKPNNGVFDSISDLKIHKYNAGQRHLCTSVSFRG